MCAMAACGTSGHRSGGPTTTTDATAYATAYTVCLQFNNTDVARNAEPATLTDDQADAIFAGLALQLKPASRKDPGAWSKLQAVADKLRKELVGSGASDDQIEKTIGNMADACTKARKRPATLPTAPPPTQIGVAVTPTSTPPTSVTPTSTP